MTLFILAGHGDVTFNDKRNLLGAISVENEIAYHLFSVDIDSSDKKNTVKLTRKSKWHSQNSKSKCKFFI